MIQSDGPHSDGSGIRATIGQWGVAGVHLVGHHVSSRGGVPSLDELHTRVTAAEQLIDTLRDLVLSLHREHAMRPRLVTDEADCS